MTISNRNDKKSIIKSLSMVTQLGVSFMVPIFLCIIIGRWINRISGYDFPVLIMIFIGIGAAFRNGYIVTKSFYAKDMEKEHKHIQYMKELKSGHTPDEDP